MIERIFVPGRLCLFGEHSDWASEYIKQNPNIKDGHAIVATIDRGIEAEVKSKSNEFILKEKNNIFRTNLKIDNIKKIAKENKYYLFVATVVIYMLKNYNVDGLEINIVNNNLPQKKGLSSSACICVLVCRAFNKIYNLNLSKNDEMEIAYICEREAKSMCGKMDQIVAFDRGVYIMDFHNGEVNYSNIKVGKDIYVVLVDLDGEKDTKKILKDLHKAFPFPKNKKEELAIKTLGEYNEKIVHEASKSIEKGNSKEIGKLMIEAQNLFDNNLAYLSPKELKAPSLHSVLNDSFIIENTLGGKGVGSQGEGTVQLIVENEKKQKEIINYIEIKFKLNAYPLKIKKI